MARRLLILCVYLMCGILKNKRGAVMRTKNEFLRCLSIIITLLFLMEIPLYADPQPGDMKYYCVIPPYVKRDVQPNILIMMDNAQIMGYAAYTDMETYDPSTPYDGIFNKDLMYSYGSSSWVPDSSGVYSGKLLNWATTSKYDLLQLILAT